MNPARVNVGNPRIQAPLNFIAPRHPITDFFLRTWLGNVLAVIGLVFTVFGAAWAIYTGVLGMRYGALQSCASLYSIGKYSVYCNKTLEAGVTPAPMIRRHLTDIWSRSDNLIVSSRASAFWRPAFRKSSHFCEGTNATSVLPPWYTANGDDMCIDPARSVQPTFPSDPALARSCVVAVFTLAAGIFAFLYTRSKMRLFPPIVSSVRTLPLTLVSVVKIVKCYHVLPLRWTARVKKRLDVAEEDDIAIFQGLVVRPIRPDEFGVLMNEDALDPAIDVDDFEALLQAQQQAFVGYTLPSDPDAVADASSDGESEILPKVQCIAFNGNETSALRPPNGDFDYFAWPEDEPSQIPPRPDLWLLTSDNDLRPNNTEYPDPTPLPPTDVDPPATILGSRGRPATLKQLHAIESESANLPAINYTPGGSMMSRWLQDDGDRLSYRIAGRGHMPPDESDNPHPLRATENLQNRLGSHSEAREHPGYPQELEISDDEVSTASNPMDPSAVRSKRRLVTRRLRDSVLEPKSLAVVTPGKARWLNLELARRSAGEKRIDFPISNH
ncbi:hypothetical protein B0A55_01656 [Friedmanniomyces simplex]|uniref:Uncharacterized protein n=1 Tax=Friedmanniomyces simplex TaxID=329884 RepID=A0A4U0XZ20_9PEZI|nr:hypothetical protein B0A55_01656 [Friedmanniomyces simplex]